MAAVWPTSDEENLGRLKDAGKWVTPPRHALKKSWNFSRLLPSVTIVMRRDTAFVTAPRLVWTALPAATASKYSIPVTAFEDIDSGKGNQAIPPLSAPNPVPPKASNANAVNKWVTSPKIVRTQAVGRVAVTAGKHQHCPLFAGRRSSSTARKAIWLKSAISPGTLQTPNAVIARKSVTSAKIAPNPVTGPKSSATLVIRTVGHTSKKCPQNNGNDDAGADGYDAGADDTNNAAAGGWEDSAGPEVAAGAAPGSGWEDTDPAPKQSTSGWGAEPTVTAGGW
ncbi:MAG: hypothetical protein Q9181_003328 [Wetmoreana brouardii]